MIKVQRLRVRTLRVMTVATTLLVTSSAVVASTALGAPSLRSQINAAVAAGEAQHYVKIVSINTAPGESQTIVAMAGPGEGIQVLSSIGSSSSEHMTVEYVNHTLYAKASVGFLEGTFGLSPGVAKTMTNKWAVVATSNPAYRAVFSAVTIASAMSFVAGAGPVTAGPATVVAGVKVKVLRVAIPKSSASPAGTETLFIARSGPPLPVESNFAGSGYSSKVKYSEWGKHFTLRAPATSLRMP